MQSVENELAQSFLRQYRRTLPHKAQAEIIHFASLASGWESEIFELTLAYQEDGARKIADLVLKVVQGEQSRQKATFEYANIKLLKRAGYPVSGVVQFSAKDGDLGPYLLMERIKGQSLKDALQSVANEAQRAALFQLFCALLVQLHGLDWQPFVTCPALYAQQDLLMSYLSTLEAPLHAYQIATFQPVFACLRKRRQEIRDAQLVVNHLDFHGENILLRDAATPVVIDWANLAIADFRLDLAWTCLLETEWREQLLSTYQRMTARQVEQFEFFEVIASLRALITVFFSLNRQATDLGLRSAVEPFLRRQGAHIQHAYTLLKSRTGIAIIELEQILERLEKM